MAEVTDAFLYPFFTQVVDDIVRTGYAQRAAESGVVTAMHTVDVLPNRSSSPYRSWARADIIHPSNTLALSDS
jgi:hypothetical protein